MEIRNLFELEDDSSFQELNQQVNSFNALKILKLENYEIRHSNTLAWLLNTKENHGLRDYFLRKIIEHLILIDENSDNPQYRTVSEILNYSLTDSHVFREVKTDQNRYIDLVIVNQQIKTVILIENKFYSTESENQLDDYLAFIKKSFEGFAIIPIYLTLDGEQPSNPDYFILTYERIEAILSAILQLNKDQLNENVYRFIEDYHQILREKFHQDQEHIVKAIAIYRNHKETIDGLFEEAALLTKPLHVASGYRFEFITKYKNTIQYIFKHGQNILSYSFEKFIHERFQDDVLYRSHPTVPHLVPPEWQAIRQFTLREPNYWLGEGLIVWFEQASDSRLRMIAEVGPIEYPGRLTLLEKLEKVGLSINESSKLEKARFTRFFSRKMDVNKWDDLAELTQAMTDLYDSPEFSLLRKQIASALDNKEVEQREMIEPVKGSLIQERASQVQYAFKKWMASKDIPETHYRISSRNLSFKVSLFDAFKDKLGETREKWWWDNGPFLFWMEIRPESLFFTLEIGPIEADKRMLLMECVKEQGIKFNKKGLEPEAKYNRIHSETVSIKGLTETELVSVFDRLFHNENLQMILDKLQVIYDETLSKLE